jgi:hypothetical protein
MLFGSNASTEIKYSGVLDDRLCLMSDVEVTPLLKGHTFPTNEILMIQIAEKANFSWCQIAIVRSDNYQVHVQGCVGSLFQIKAFCSLKLGWKVTTIQTREASNADNDPREDTIHDGQDKVVDEDKASFEEGDADKNVKQVQQHTPIKSCWIVPLLLSKIAEKQKPYPMQR